MTGSDVSKLMRAHVRLQCDRRCGARLNRASCCTHLFVFRSHGERQHEAADDVEGPLVQLRHALPQHVAVAAWRRIKRTLYSVCAPGCLARWQWCFCSCTAGTHCTLWASRSAASRTSHGQEEGQRASRARRKPAQQPQQRPGAHDGHDRRSAGHYGHDRRPPVTIWILHQMCRDEHYRRRLERTHVKSLCLWLEMHSKQSWQRLTREPVIRQG